MKFYEPSGNAVSNKNESVLERNYVLYTFYLDTICIN